MLDTPDTTTLGRRVTIQPRLEEHITLAGIFNHLRVHVRLIASFIAGCMALGFAYCLVATPIFTAKAQILIDQQAQYFTDAGREERQIPIDSAAMESQIAVLRSERLLTSVITSLNLIKDPDVCRPSWFSGLRSTVLGPPPEQETAFARERCIIGRLQDELGTRRVLTSFAIDITFSSPNPAKAASIANAVAEAYVRDQTETRSENARQAGQWLQGRIDQLRVQMNTAMQAVQEFKAKRDYRIEPHDAAVATGNAAAGTPRDATAKHAATSTLEELETAAKTYYKMYESYLEAFAQTVQRASYRVSNARIITEATKPLDRSQPRTGLILLFCGLMGALLGIGASFVREKFAGAFHWPFELKQLPFWAAE